MKKEKITWPPTASKRHQYDGKPFDSGMPSLLEFVRYQNDKTLSTNEWVRCCACRYTHLATYNLMRAPDNKFYLISRVYAYPDSDPRRKRKGKKK